MNTEPQAGSATPSVGAPAAHAAAPAAAHAAISLSGVDKSFGAVHANIDVSLEIMRGTIHGIVGENGAGKSTLMNILYGYYQADRGEIRVNGQLATLGNSQQAIALGIGMVHQHFMLVDDFTVLENMVLGQEKSLQLAGTLASAREHLAQMARQYDMRVDPDARIDTLGVGQQQRVEVLKALFRGAEILILDEPSAVLTPEETDHLFRILLALKAEGKTVVLITHKLREILQFTDSVTVMRAGRVVGTVPTASTDAAQLAEMMVGRSVQMPGADRSQAAPGRAGAPLLQVTQLCLAGERGQPLLSNIDLTLYPGEIVGIAGVAGNGQSELLEVLAGMQSADSGSIRLRDQEIAKLHGKLPNAALYRSLGIAHVPEDRLKSGVVKSFSCAENAILGSAREADLNRRGLLDRQKIGQRILNYIRRFDIRPTDPTLRLGLLSGGNQQKLVLAREIERNAALMLIGQPTRGVDIGAIEMIHQTLLQLRAEGKAILLVSVELDEIMALSDRIVVMCGGKITGTLTADQFDRATIGQLMGGK
jgi:simple sugar transport system ATP-binding protein